MNLASFFYTLFLFFYLAFLSYLLIYNGFIFPMHKVKIKKIAHNFEKKVDLPKPDIKGISLKLLQICTSNKF